MSIGIRGIGCVSSFGIGVDKVWTAALTDISGISKNFQISDDPELEKHGSSRAVNLALAAADEALVQAGWDHFDALILATTTGQISVWENPWFQFFKKNLSSEEVHESLQSQPLGSLTSVLQKKFSVRGPTLLLTSACSASTQALGIAAMWIKQKKAKRCLVGGVEIFSKLTVEGFKSLQLLSETASTPFSKNRKGINLSEASAFLCLEESDSALAHLTGYGFSTDAYHITSPHPEGRGIYQAMSAALKSACMVPDEISYVHAHATGSIANDVAEATAIHHLLGSKHVAATKSIHGHALAASGALETILCVKSLQHEIQLKTFGLTEMDPALKIQVSNENKKGSVTHILKNTLGFGGNNASLVLSKEPV